MWDGMLARLEAALSTERAHPSWACFAVCLIYDVPCSASLRAEKKQRGMCVVERFCAFVFALCLSFVITYPVSNVLMWLYVCKKRGCARACFLNRPGHTQSLLTP